MMWVTLKSAAALTGIPMETIRRWKNSHAVRGLAGLNLRLNGARGRGIRYAVWLPDVQACKRQWLPDCAWWLKHGLAKPKALRPKKMASPGRVPAAVVSRLDRAMRDIMGV